MSKVLSFLREVWLKLDGWKTVIGLFLMVFQDRIHLPDTWYVQLISVIIYLWTGVGLTDKVRKQVIIRNANKAVI